MPRPMRGPGRGRNYEKSKDFFGSMKRLLKNLKKWYVFLIVALVLAGTSAIFSLITPDMLSNLTNTITSGISPKMDKLTDVISGIGSNFTGEKIGYYLNSDLLSNEDKMLLNNVISLPAEQRQMALLALPERILSLFINDIYVDDVLISKDDQLKMLSLSKNINTEDKSANLELINSLPESVSKVIKPSIDIEKVKSIAFVMGTLYVLSALFSYIQSFLLATASNNFAKNLRSRINNKIDTLPLKYFDSHETGDILSRVTNDVDTIAQNLNQSLATLVTSITLFVGSVIMMFVSNYIMAITAIVSSIVGFSLMFIILNKSQKYFIQRQTELGNIDGYIEEIYSGHNVVRVSNGTADAIKEFDKLNDKLFEANRKSQFLSGLMGPVMGFVGNFGYVMVCIVGSLLVMNDVISFGTIVAFMIYVRLFTNPLSQIAQAMTSLQSTAAASERVFEFLDEQEMKNEEALDTVLNPADAKGEIEFKNVNFGYNDDRMIIKNFNATVKPGQKIAIVGPTGAGKTTMVNLLMKFYEISDGDILIDGKSIHDLTRENIHDLFGMVLQDTWLFEGTIKDNLKYNNENLSDDDIYNACKVVGINHFVKTLPGGINSLIGDNDSISQGQKQLLTIARSMLASKPFLILDEATSNVDTRTEELVQKAMDKLTEGRTSFIIAHRLSTIKNADLILVMKEGNIIEAGNHEELLQQHGFYAELYNSQFESVLD